MPQSITLMDCFVKDVNETVQFHNCLGRQDQHPTILTRICVIDVFLTIQDYLFFIHLIMLYICAVPDEKAAKISPEKLNSTLYFPMPFSVTEDSLQTATLLVYVTTPAGYEGRSVTVNVLTNPWSKIVESRKVTLRGGGHWEHIDITEQCRTWLRHEWKNNLGLVVEAEIDGIELITYNSNSSNSNSSYERVSYSFLWSTSSQQLLQLVWLSSKVPKETNPSSSLQIFIT